MSKAEIKTVHRRAVSYLTLEDWYRWLVGAQERFSRNGYYIASTGHHVYIRQYIGGDERETALWLNIGQRCYEIKRPESYSPHGLKMLAARFVKDVLELIKAQHP